MKKVAYYGVLILLIGIFCFSAYKIGDYLLEKHRSDQMMNEASKFVTVETGEKKDDKKKAPERIKVDFDKLREQNEDIVAWLYCGDTKLNYPVVQAADNDYYLYRLLDGSYNRNGTIFMDYRSSADMTDGNTLIHGHHMRSGAMFGELIHYQKQKFYDQHPVIYLSTPEKNYRLDLLAGCVVEHDDEIYTTDLTEEQVAHYMANSTFTSEKEYKGGQIVTLSTCSYDFEDARYVVMGELVPLKD